MNAGSNLWPEFLLLFSIKASQNKRAVKNSLYNTPEAMLYFFSSSVFFFLPPQGPYRVLGYLW